jgi:hypothetical protein
MVVFTEINHYILSQTDNLNAILVFYQKYDMLLPDIYFFYSSLHPFYFLSENPNYTHKTLLWAYHNLQTMELDIIVSFVTPQQSSSLNTKASNSYVNKIDNRQTVYSQFKFIVFLYRTAIPDQKTTSKQELALIFLQT